MTDCPKMIAGIPFGGCRTINTLHEDIEWL